ncbi:hypothetical protein F4825DRAFT_430440 [Nemania diffusa]|nr:hypothetical protein F4825DRAFT_430440 [Nemania diffusa]
MPDTAETPASFASLPSELRNEIYELILLHEEPLHPLIAFDCFRPRKGLTPGLLRVSKAVHREASSLFYGNNHFNLSYGLPRQAIFFLKRIGSNAAYIRHLAITFPDFFCLDPGDVTLDKDSVSVLATIKRRCTNLNSLTTALYWTTNIDHRIDWPDSHKIADEPLELVDAHFRAITSLQEINLAVYEHLQSDQLRQITKCHGWTISTLQPVEEDRGWRFRDFIDRGDFGDNNYDDYGHNDLDDYGK